MGDVRLPVECAICGNPITIPTADHHTRERSPMDPQLCLGCWLGSVELELWYVRATERNVWSLKVQEWMRQFIEEQNK